MPQTDEQVVSFKTLTLLPGRMGIFLPRLSVLLDRERQDTFPRSATVGLLAPNTCIRGQL